MTSNLTTLLREKLAFEEAHSFAHPCAQTCSGWSQGIGAGRAQENARLQPTLKLLLNVIAQLDAFDEVVAEDGCEPKYVGDHYQVLHDALHRLREGCGE